MYAANKLPLNPTFQNLEIGTKNIEVVKEFIYHGSQINSTNAVSYTHLDVYKRQIEDHGLNSSSYN